MISITSFSTSKDTGTGSSSSNNSTGGISPTITVTQDIEPVTIWGQTHDHTVKNIDGTMTIHGNINQSGTINTSGDVNATNGNFTTIHTDELYSPEGVIDSLNSTQIDTFTLDAQAGYIDNLESNNANIDKLVNNILKSKDATIHNLEVTGQAHFFELVIDKIKAAGGAVILSAADGFKVDFVRFQIRYNYITLNQSSGVKILNQANYFIPIGYYLVDLKSDIKGNPNSVTEDFSLSDGGDMFVRRFDNKKLYRITNTLTPYLDDTNRIEFQTMVSANEFDDLFETTYKCLTPDFANVVKIWLYWRAVDEVTGNAKVNMWQTNDQLICQNFNQAEVGTTHDVRNKYYWGLVKNINSNGYYEAANQIVDENGELVYETETYNCNVITFENDTSEGVSGDAYGYVDPEPGDEIAMLGHRGTDLARRQAIYIAAYKSIDPDISAPLFAQYRDICTFSLEGKADSYFSRDENKITGDTIIWAGTDLNDKFDEFETNLDEKYGDQLDEMINALDPHVAVLTPVKPVSSVTYAQWKSMIGNTYNFTCPLSTPADATAFDAEISVGKYVLIEQPDKATKTTITLYGKVTATVGIISPVGRRVTVLIKMVLNANLNDLYTKYSSLQVNVDSITSTVGDLQEGVSQLEQTATSLTSSINGLDGRVSTVEQTLDDFTISITDDLNDLSSEFHLSKDDMEIRVGDLEFRMDNDIITLGGNTVINGDLELNAEEQGLKIVGPNEETLYIKPKDLSTYTAFSNDSNGTNTYAVGVLILCTSAGDSLVNSNPSTGTAASSGYKYKMWGIEKTYKVTLGTFGDATTSLTNLSINMGATSANCPSGPNYPLFAYTNCSGKITSVTAKIYGTSQGLINGATTQLTLPTASGGTSYGGTNTILSNYNFYTKDNYYMMITVKGNVWVYYPTNSSATNYWLANAAPRVTISSSIKRNSAKNAYALITYNGMGINFGNFATIYFGAEGFRVKYGNYGLGLTNSASNPFEKWDTSTNSWVPWQKLKELY